MTDKYSISQALGDATRQLSSAGLAEPRREAASLLGFVLRQERAFLVMNSNLALTGDERERFSAVVRQRANREPFQYITGHQEFFGLDFVVSPDVLIPRPETELLVEKALDLIRPDAPAQRICDIGTGSGCILITLLNDRTQLCGVGLDISRAALLVAAQNASALGVATRIDLRESDCFSGLAPGEDRFSLIVSNPPYITAKDFAAVQPKVANFEPQLALTPGGDGLSVIRRIVAEAPEFLEPGGHLLIEIGYDQAAAVNELIAREIWPEFEILPDLQGIPRCVVLGRP